MHVAHYRTLGVFLSIALAATVEARISAVFSADATGRFEAISQTALVPTNELTRYADCPIVWSTSEGWVLRDSPRFFPIGLLHVPGYSPVNGDDPNSGGTNSAAFAVAQHHFNPIWVVFPMMPMCRTTTPLR